MSDRERQSLCGEGEEVRPRQADKSRSSGGRIKENKNSVQIMPTVDSKISDLISFFKRQRRLANIDRCNQTPKIKHYSVAEHNYYSVLFGMVLCDLVNMDNQQSDLNSKPICTEEVLRRLILHDHEESITGDILFPLHNEFPEFAFQLNIVRQSVVDTQVFKELPEPIKDYYARLWSRSKDDSIEGQMVAVIDKFEILMFSIQEIEMGNTSFRQIFHNAVHILLENCPFVVVKKLVNQIAILY